MNSNSVRKIIRSFNEILKTDAYLQNRFRVKQVATVKEDGTRYYMFEIRDSVTKVSSRTHWFADYEFYNNHMPRNLFNIFNDFIIKKLHNLKEK